VSYDQIINTEPLSIHGNRATVLIVSNLFIKDNSSPAPFFHQAFQLSLTMVEVHGCTKCDCYLGHPGLTLVTRGNLLWPATTAKMGGHSDLKLTIKTLQV